MSYNPFDDFPMIAPMATSTPVAKPKAKKGLETCTRKCGTCGIRGHIATSGGRDWDDAYAGREGLCPFSLAALTWSKANAPKIVGNWTQPQIDEWRAKCAAFKAAWIKANKR